MLDRDFISELETMPKDRAALYVQWDAMEHAQAAWPHAEFGWDGYVLLYLHRDKL